MCSMGIFLTKKDILRLHKNKYFINSLNSLNFTQRGFFEILFTGKTTCTSKGEESAAAVCVKATVPPKQSTDLEFTLTWDMPIIHFKAKEKFYARFRFQSLCHLKS